LVATVAKQQQLTVREIAELIQRPREELMTVIDRIRGWTDVGLLRVAGTKSPGTGVKRLYEPASIIDAVVMTALTDVGLAAIRVGRIAGSEGKNVFGFGRMGACDILDPAKNERPVFLIISGPKPSPWNVALSNGETTLNQLPPNESYSIIIRLNDYFRPLRGIVTAVLEHGFVKIELVSKRKA
jgi:hypothetical protein